MTAPLISDATLAKIVRSIGTDEGLARIAERLSNDPVDTRLFDVEIAGRLVRALARESYADALDMAQRWASSETIALIEEANEEAAREHDRREAADLLDPEKTSEAQVDAMLRAEGIDPAALADRGAAFANAEIEKRARVGLEILRAMKLLSTLGRGDVADDLGDAARAVGLQ